MLPASIVTLASLVAGFAMLSISAWEQIFWERPVRDDVRQALTAATEVVVRKKKAKLDGGGLHEEADIAGLSQTLEGMAKFATGLRELERSTRGYLIGLAFFGIAFLSSAVATVRV
jgi:hypothetical protein